MLKSVINQSSINLIIRVRAMKMKHFLLISVLIIFSISSVLGSQIVRFKSGTVLVAHEYRVEGKMIYLTLSKDNEVGFPMSLVDKIEERDVISGDNDLFNRKKGGVSGHGPTPFSGSDPIPAGFTSETDSLSKYRTNKSKSQRSPDTSYSRGSYLGGQDTREIKRAISALHGSSEPGAINTGTSSDQNTKPSVSISKGRHFTAGKHSSVKKAILKGPVDSSKIP